MTLDFTSSATDVLLNPRMKGDERRRIQSALGGHTQFAGHIWLSTSGTSGKLKFAALSKEGILHSATAVNSHLGSDAKDCWINVLPTFHVGGIGILARAFISGAKVLSLYEENYKWDPLQFANAANEAKATLSALVPTQVFDLVENGIRAPTSLRAVIVGGGALEESLRLRALSLGWRLLPSYGMTECSSQVATASIGEEVRFKILEHVEIKTTSEGYILIKSPSLLSSYVTVENDRLVFSDPKVEGWFRTEDKGEADGSYLKFFGRSSDFLKVGGESVSLAAVNLKLKELKGKLGISEETILYATQDFRLGQKVSLCIEGKRSEKSDLLVESLNQAVLPFERVKSVCYVDKIPRSDLGKPLLKELKELEGSWRI